VLEAFPGMPLLIEIKTARASASPPGRRAPTCGDCSSRRSPDARCSRCHTARRACRGRTAGSPSRSPGSSAAPRARGARFMCGR
jgi:hypothetical protein